MGTVIAMFQKVRSFIILADQNRNKNTRVPDLPSATLGDCETSSDDEKHMKSNAYPVQTKNRRQVYYLRRFFVFFSIDSFSPN